MGQFKFANTLRGYRREWLSADIAAAAMLLVIAVPEQLATSRLAQMPPITGFYAFICGTLAIAVLGSSPQLSVGADSTVAPLFATAVGALALAGSGRYQELVAILAVMTGALVALVWLLRLGWLAEFLSEPIIAGFLGGIAVVIVVHQLPDLLGIPAGAGGTLRRISHALSQLHALHWWSLAIGLGVFATVAGMERLDRRLPGALVALLLSSLLVAVAGLQAHGVAVLGHVAHGAPRLGLSHLSLRVLGQLAPVAGTVALVIVSQTAASTRAFAQQGGYEVDVGRDLLGTGAGSIAAGLFGAFPVDASPPRTAAVAQAGGRTQLSGLLAALVLAALIPAAGLLREVPLAALSGVLLFIATRLLRLGELRAIARFDPLELGLALVTLLFVALLGVEQGIGVAVALAILDRTRRSARAQLHVLGRIPQSTSWAPVGASGARELEGVLVVLFATPLWYADAAHFRSQLHDTLRRDHAAQRAPRALVLDTMGMNDLDYTGAQVLAEVLDLLEREQIEFAIARAGQRVRTQLMRAGLAPARIPPARFFPDVDAAVQALQAVRGRGARAADLPPGEGGDREPGTGAPERGADRIGGDGGSAGGGGVAS